MERNWCAYSYSRSSRISRDEPPENDAYERYGDFQSSPPFSNRIIFPYVEGCASGRHPYVLSVYEIVPVRWGYFGIDYSFCMECRGRWSGPIVELPGFSGAFSDTGLNAGEFSIMAADRKIEV